MIKKGNEDFYKKSEALAEEVTDIVDSIKGIKGEEYAEVVMNLFTLQNLVGMLLIDNTTMQSLAGIPSDKLTVIGIPSAQFVHTLVANIANLTRNVAVPFVVPFEGHDEYPARHNAKVKEIMNDVSILMDKQQEYNKITVRTI